MTEPTTTGDPFKVLAVERQGDRKLLLTIAEDDGTPRQLTVTAAVPGDGPHPGLEYIVAKYGTDAVVTGVLGAPGVPDEDPAEAHVLPDPQDMSLGELLDEAAAQIARIEEENPHA